ncbi:MAG: glutaredoxin family protein [Ardenticatenaceae bacterium]|nr:glutaredoxin family protein [Ardenticatenaceae bacterium]
MNNITNNTSDIIMYTTNWCSDCYRAKWFFDNYGINYEEVQLENNPDAIEKVLHLNKGMRSVPTIVFPDGSVLVEPSNNELASKVGVTL